MNLEQFKKIYQGILDAGKDPRAVRMNPIDAKTIWDQYNRMWWGLPGTEIKDLYGLEVIIDESLKEGTVVFGTEQY